MDGENANDATAAPTLPLTTEQKSGYIRLIDLLRSATTFELTSEIFTQNEALLDVMLLRRFRTQIEDSSGLFAPYFLHIIDILNLAVNNHSSAWTSLITHREHLAAVTSEVERDIHLIQQLQSSGGPMSLLAVSMAETAIEKCTCHIELTPHVKTLLTSKAEALYHLHVGNRAETLERCIDTTRFSLSIWPNDVRLLMHLGVVLSDRVYGEHATNQREAINAFRRALEAHEAFMSSKSPSTNDITAMILTNLAVGLMRYHSSGTGDEKEDTDGLEEAVRHCESALTIRSPEVSLIDWAFSQFNFADAIEKLVYLGHRDINEVNKACQPILDRRASFEEANCTHFVTRCYHLRGRALLHHSRKDSRVLPSDVPHYLLSDELISTPLLSKDTLTQARRDLDDATLWAAKGADSSLRAAIVIDLFDVLVELRLNDEAIQYGNDNISLVTPQNVLNPSARWRFGQGLGYLHVLRKEWSLAAPAYRIALEGANEIAYAPVRCIDTNTQQMELSSASRFYRWAAYVLGASGDLESAMLTLEDGRARELRHRFLASSSNGLPELDQALIGVPEPLREAYKSALDALSRSPLTASGTESLPTRTLRGVIQAIREIPDHRDFAKGVKVSDILPAVEEGWPLLYINPTPFGTLLLLVQRDKETSTPASAGRGLRYSSRLLEGVTSGQITTQCYIGHQSQLLNVDDWEAYRRFEDRELPGSLANLLGWMGDSVARHVYDFLKREGGLLRPDARAHNLKGATIIACGHISIMPIDNATWLDRQENTKRCLSDAFVLRYAPSAVIAASCARKAYRFDQASLTPTNPSIFVAIGNPLEDLPSAHLEVSEIASLFSPFRTECHIAFEHDATQSFVTTHAPNATYFHLSTHARPNYVDTVPPTSVEDQACIFFSDGPLPATQLPAMLSLASNRLTVISACESAARGLDLPDEGFSVGTVMLASGSACAIGSLWRVDDCATALLMVKVYEEMLGSGGDFEAASGSGTKKRPPEALGVARKWLRELDLKVAFEEDTFFARHPKLMDDLRQNGYVQGKLFEHPFFWAGFIALGV